MTNKQIKFVSNYAKGFNKKESAILAGYSKKNASKIASSLMKLPHIQQSLENHGLTDDYIARKLKQSIEAGNGIKANETTKLIAIDKVMELRGYKQKEANTTTNNIYINELNVMSDEELDKHITELEQELQTVDATDVQAAD